MDPIVLAYLIMGDGNFDKGRNRVRIYTNSFIKQEVEELALSINKNLERVCDSWSNQRSGRLFRRFVHDALHLCLPTSFNLIPLFS
jgi:hypothetical protein